MSETSIIVVTRVVKVTVITSLAAASLFTLSWWLFTLAPACYRAPDHRPGFLLAALAATVLTCLAFAAFPATRRWAPAATVAAAFCCGWGFFFIDAVSGFRCLN